MNSIKNVCNFLMEIFKKNQNNAERALRFTVALFLIPTPLVLGTNLYSFFLLSIGIILLFNAVDNYGLNFIGQYQNNG